MIISFSPVRMDAALNIARKGDVLTINGSAYDFGPLPEGGRLPREAVDCPWLASDVTREGGILRLTLILPHGAYAPPQTLFPAPVTMTGDGPVPVPPQGAQMEDVE